LVVSGKDEHTGHDHIVGHELMSFTLLGFDPVVDWMWGIPSIFSLIIKHLVGTSRMMAIAGPLIWKVTVFDPDVVVVAAEIIIAPAIEYNVC
jgi:hypothetical protein